MEFDKLITSVAENGPFSDYIDSYGLETVKNMVEFLYDNAADAAREMDMDVEEVFDNYIDALENNPADVEIFIEDWLF